MEVDVIQVPAGRGTRCLDQSRTHYSKVREETDPTVFLTEEKAEKPRKIKYINVLGPKQTTSSSQNSWISGTSSSGMLTSGQLTNRVVQEFSFLPKKDFARSTARKSTWEGMSCPCPQSHSLGHGLHARPDLLPVLIEGVDLHDGSSHRVHGEILGERERSCSGRS